MPATSLAAVSSPPLLAAVREVRKSIAHCSTVFIVRLAFDESSVLGSKFWSSESRSLVWRGGQARHTQEQVRVRWFRLLHTTPTEAHGDIWGGVEGIPCAAQRPHRRLNGWVCQSFVGEGGKTSCRVPFLCASARQLCASPCGQGHRRLACGSPSASGMRGEASGHPRVRQVSKRRANHQGRNPRDRVLSASFGTGRG